MIDVLLLIILLLLVIWTYWLFADCLSCLYVLLIFDLLVLVLVLIGVFIPEFVLWFGLMLVGVVRCISLLGLIEFGYLVGSGLVGIATWIMLAVFGCLSLVFGVWNVAWFWLFICCLSTLLGLCCEIRGFDCTYWLIC